ncbi:MAG TPA: insulinase family protein, partial [Saprospiraceae bacterium]|nr:insulinase family protein [Saprospiraceae bacterium]
TIGKKMEHIADARLEDVRQFYDNFYGPNNAILAVAGPDETTIMLEKIKRWFGQIPARSLTRLHRFDEPPQQSKRILEDEGKYPSSVLYLAWLMDGRNGRDYYAYDLLSDVMSLGRSSLFYQHLVKEQKVCAHVDAYITGTEEPGLFIIEARPAKNIALEVMESQIWNELGLLQEKQIDSSILFKLKNKNESTVSFSNVSASHKATNLAYYESLGDAELINTEAERIAEITQDDVLRVANVLKPDYVNILRLIGNGAEYVEAAMEDGEDDAD